MNQLIRLTGLSVLLISCYSSKAFAQESINASGAELSGNTGTISYSIGQVVYQTMETTDASFSEGVQQPYEIYVIDGVERSEISVKLTAYPNPTTDAITLTVGDHSMRGLALQIVDMAGQQILTATVTDKNTRIDLSQYAMATYYLTVLENEKPIKTFKIIKTGNQ